MWRRRESCKFICITFLTFLVIDLSAKPASDSIPDMGWQADESYEELLLLGLESFYQTRWNEADDRFDRLIQMDPEDPRGYFFQSMLPFWSYFFVEQSREHADRFLAVAEQAIGVAERRLEQVPEDTLSVMLLSGLYGYKSLVEAGENRYRKAILDGRTGFQYTRQLLELEEVRPDARIGRGMYHYMVGSVPGGLKWLVRLFGLEGDKATGFEELRIAAQTESYARVDAQLILATLYQREDRPQEALQYLRQLTQEFEQNVIFLFQLAESLEMCAQPELAAAIFQDLVQRDHPRFPELTRLSRERLKQLSS
ncbi:MAG: tetratricopeptide repeat protein [Balneolaceae bacterium]